ncbi:MAG: hypothetical protein ACLRM8_10015 [Alistipes sp.]
MMKWAQQVAVEEYADHRIVLMTHAYLDAKPAAVRSLQGTSRWCAMAGS